MLINVACEKVFSVRNSQDKMTSSYLFIFDWNFIRNITTYAVDNFHSACKVDSGPVPVVRFLQGTFALLQACSS